MSEQIIGTFIGSLLVISLFLPAGEVLIEHLFNNNCGPKHCSIVWANGCGGNIDLTKPDEDKLYRDWFMFRDYGAEYKYISRFGEVKTYGYVRDDHVEINGKRYYFSKL